MRLLELCAVALSATAGYAFQDASPYMAFSTADLDWTAPRIATHKTVQDSLSRSLAECPTDFYIFAHQPNVNSNDYTSRSTPHLKEWLERASRGITYGVAVSEMVGDVDSAALQKALKSQCGAEKLNIDASTAYFNIPASSKSRILTVNLPEVGSGKKRADNLRANDLILSNLISALPTQSFTLLYSTTPCSDSTSETVEYEMEEQPFFHTDMKRDLNAHVRADNDNIVLVNGPLFERYQYFTPGLFMGLIAMAFILTIAYVAVRALASLEVSYAAFDKENGPSGQKKSQ